MIQVNLPRGVISTPTFVLTGTVVDDVAVAAADWKIGAGPTTPIALTDGAFTITIDAPLLDSQNAQIFLRARDSRTEAVTQVDVQIDRVAPVLRLVRPDAGSLTGASAVEVAVEAIDGSGLLADFSIGGVPVGNPRSGIEAISTIAVPATLNGDPLDFAVTASDPAGNRSTQTVSLKGDRVAPTVTFAGLSSNQLVNSASLTIEVEVIDPSPISGVIVHFGPSPSVASEGPAGHWVATVPTSVVEQDEVIRVEATDLAGNVALAQLTVRVDRVPPTVAIAAPMAGSLHRLDLAVTATTSTGTTSVTADLEGQLVTLAGGPTLWTGTLTVPQRDYSSASVRVTASDLAGNLASSDVTVNVDTVAPVIAFTAPTPAQRFNASAFASSPNVTVAWTVTDADTQAATTTVNGSASTALTTAVPTTANDNPASYSTTVNAADRAGNTASQTVSWSVDRRAPTVVSWVPAANTRNVEPWQSVITFSERVSGPLSTSPALTITGQTAPANDSWDTAHAVYTLPLDAFRSRVLDVAIAASVADDYGNPVAASTRRFHLATGFGSPSNTLIAPGISAFDASSDNDGVVSIGLTTMTGYFNVYKDTGGAFTLLTNPQPLTFPGRVSVNSANVVSSSLQSSHRLGITLHVPNLTYQYWRYTFVDGVLTAAPTSYTEGAVVSRPPFPSENSTALFGTIDGASYTRGSLVRTLPNAVKSVVAQSNDSWVAFDTNASQVLWSHYRCRTTVTGPYCSGIGYGASATGAAQLQSSLSPGGNCLAASWTSGTTRQAVFQPLSPCDLIACFDDTNLALTPSIPVDLRTAPFGANGENTMLFSYRLGTTQFALAKMNVSCGPSSTSLGAVPSGKAHQPVQVGKRAGLLYINNADELRLYVP